MTIESQPRIGSLFSGSGMLDRAVEQATGGRVVWHCENDRAAKLVLAERWPGVPNLGDVRRVNWSRIRWSLGPVDILCGGFPCTDISPAGRQAGLAPGTQSGLWVEFVRAIDALRPQAVVIENVRNLLHVRANIRSTLGRMGPDQRDMAGDPRGIGAVLGDLADLGFDAEWEVVPASDAGAPHRRQRIFVVAHTRRR